VLQLKQKICLAYSSVFFSLIRIPFVFCLWFVFLIHTFPRFTAWVHALLCKLQKGCTRLAAASDKVYQLLAHGRWFFPGTAATSTTKTGRHNIAEILLKVALNTKKLG
jgi:hypothetical protein